MIVLHVCLVVHFVYFHSKYCLISFKFWMHHKNALHVCLLIHFLCVCDRTGGKKTAAPNKISKRNLPFKVTVKKCDKVEKTWALALDKLMFKCPTLLLVSCVCLGKRLTFSEPSFPCSEKWEGAASGYRPGPFQLSSVWV